MSLEKFRENIGLIEIECSLCRKELLVKDTKAIGKWAFHDDCYRLALYRLDKFMDIILFSQEEFDEWMKDKD